MCRIAGILSPSSPVAEIEAMVKQMCNSLKHGGPDDEGFYTDAANKLVFGHRRLALIDLSPGGHQPMSYADGRYWICYNGELYNYVEIKAELVQAGFQFKSASDTEVMLAAFTAWGSNAFRRFNGMFAFALWDSVTATQYLVRDVNGIKPLYYGLTEQGLCFASELRAFKAVPWLQEENKNWPVYLLAYGHLPEPVTTLKEVRPLPKGSFLQYHPQSGKCDIELFAFNTYSERISDREEAKKLIRSTLSAAVKRHLISDAPIGVFLSGGLDSSIMAVLAAKQHQAALKTLSISFDDTKFSERQYQELVTSRIQFPNSQLVLTEKEFQLQLPAIINAMDMPGCDGINTWFISKCAADNGLKAVLSGLGGDELFGGYPSFKRMDKVRWLNKMPATLLRAGRYAGSRKFKRLPYLSLGGSRGYYLFLRGQSVPSEIAERLNMSEKQVWNILEDQPAPDCLDGLSAGNQASWIEMNMYMQNQLLRDSDVMSMAHGIEIRVPFLDKEFVNLALGIEPGIKYAGAYPKQMLIDSFEDDLPRPVWDRPKMGFTFPFAEWLGANEFVKDTMSRAGKAGEDNFEKFRKGEMHWSQLLTLLLLNVRSKS